MATSDQQSNRQPSMQVIEAVASEERSRPEELSPLYAAIDPDALDALLDSVGNSGNGVIRVEFTYEGYLVTVSGDGRVDVSSVST